MNVLLASGAVLIACLVAGWAFSVMNHVRAKDQYVNLFKTTTIEFLENPEFNSGFKELLAKMSYGLQDKQIADHVAKAIDDGESHPLRPELEKLLEGVRQKPTDEQQRFLMAIFYYMMALSYSSRRHGRVLRNRFRSELPDRQALLMESQRAYQAQSSIRDKAVAA